MDLNVINCLLDLFKSLTRLLAQLLLAVFPKKIKLQEIVTLTEAAKQPVARLNLSFNKFRQMEST